jgi:hypothetical protein
MGWLVWLAAWAVLVFVLSFDPVLTTLILLIMAGLYWWFLQCRA